MTDTERFGSPLVILYVCLVLLNIVFVVTWVRTTRARKVRERPTAGDLAIGVGTNFLDTLGIGNYAQITALSSCAAGRKMG